MDGKPLTILELEAKDRSFMRAITAFMDPNELYEFTVHLGSTQIEIKIGGNEIAQMLSELPSDEFVWITSLQGLTGFKKKDVTAFQIIASKFEDEESDGGD